MLKSETDSKYRLCQQFDDKIKHIPACPILAKQQHINGHDRLCDPLHVDTCSELSVIFHADKEHWYQYILKLVQTLVPTYTKISTNKTWR